MAKTKLSITNCSFQPSCGRVECDARSVAAEHKAKC